MNQNDQTLNGRQNKRWDDRQLSEQQLRIERLSPLSKEALETLLEVWITSVRATHSFLSEEQIQALLPFVQEGLISIENLLCIRNASGAILAFMGVEDHKIEMLFVRPEVRGKGLGRRLMSFAIDTLKANLIDVNEQNPLAAGFYQHLGFHVIDRSELDDQGNPFPILHMSL